MTKKERGGELQETGTYWKTRCKQICDGNCLYCIHDDCRVPAITIQAEKILTGGGIKHGYPRMEHVHSMERPRKATVYPNGRKHKNAIYSGE